MAWVKTVLLNITITFALLFMLMLTPPLVNLVKNKGSTDPRDTRADLALYDQVKWANQHFLEFSQLKTTYQDYITWRRKDFSGETINIKNGIRQTVAPSQRNSASEFWFFGGSTTWGTGVNDKNTYPSLFAKKTGYLTKNYGESGYIARQSLSYLQNLYILGEGGKNTVVFYDGANDVTHRCRHEITGMGSVREEQIKAILGSGPAGKYSFSRIFGQLQDFAQDLGEKMFGKDSPNRESLYSCATNSERADFIALSLVNTWIQAKKLARENGDEFIAILQPISFLGSAKSEYLKLNDGNSLALKKQFEAVYPLILEYAKTADINFFDMTDAYDGCGNCYVDFSHVGPQAHEKLVEQMAVHLIN